MEISWIMRSFYDGTENSVTFAIPAEQVSSPSHDSTAVPEQVSDEESEETSAPETEMTAEPEPTGSPELTKPAEYSDPHLSSNGIWNNPLLYIGIAGSALFMAILIVLMGRKKFLKEKSE